MDLKPTMRRQALMNYCIANNCYDKFVREMLTRKASNGRAEYVNRERAEKFISAMVPMFSPFIWDWYNADKAVPTVQEFREKLGMNKIK